MLGREVILTLVDGTSLRGTVGWCWGLDHWRLRDVSALGDSGPVSVSGSMLIPKTSVLTAQVV